jgi:ABC-2 type transport system permease protein
MGERVGRILIKEFLQAFRDVKMRGIIFALPVIQTLIFSYAVTTDVKRIPTAVYDLDASAASREVRSRFTQSGYFQVAAWVADSRQAQDLLDRSQVQAVLYFRPGFEGDLKAGRTARLQIVLDGTDSTTAGIVLQYAARIAQRFSQGVQLEQRQRLHGAERPPVQVDLRSRAWFNENLESRNFFVPGVIALIVSLITLLLTSMSVVREKELGTLEQLMVTPITRWDFILGKTVPFALIALVDLIIVTTVAVCWFEVPVRGSLPLLFGATSLYILTTLGIGLWISTVSQTQRSEERRVGKEW